MCTYRLAFAVVKYFPFGGMQRNLLRIARACAARGHDVHVFASEWEGPEPEELTVHVLSVSSWTNHGRNEKFADALRAALAEHDFDCIVGSNRAADLHVYYAGDPCYAARFRQTKPRIYSLLPRYRSFLRQEDAVFRPEADTEILLAAHVERDKFIRHYDTPPGRFRLLPPGVDRSRLLDDRPSATQRASLREELGVGEGDLLLLSVGSGFKTKGVDRTIRALAALPEPLRTRCRLAVVGHGKPGACATLARWLGVGDRVTFTGPREDLCRFYHAADVLVHPARVENTGNALIEAMVCGLAVIATASCGYADHVRCAGAGPLCPVPFEQATLDRELAELVGDDGRRAACRRKALEYAAQADLYGLVDRAADAIIERARRNREAARGVELRRA